MKRPLQPTLFGGVELARSSTARRPQGYAANPGTGPAGETCRSCLHCRKFSTWSKCALILERWTTDISTDVLRTSPACSLWASLSSAD